MDDWSEEEPQWSTDSEWSSEFDDSEWKALFTPVTSTRTMEMEWYKEILYCMKTNQLDLMKKRLKLLSKEQLQLFFTLFPTEEQVHEMDVIQEELAQEEEEKEE